MTVSPALLLRHHATSWHTAKALLQGPVPLVAGWLLVFWPVYLGLWQTLWQEDAHAHGPLIGLIVAVLLWRLRHQFAVLPAPTSILPGMLLLAGGLALAIVGEVQDIPLLAMAAQIPVLAALLLARHGWAGLRAAWFPLAYLAFMIPLPGIAINAVTQPLKEWISLATSHLLHAANYPIAHSGVILVIGQYQLLIADACSGLHSFMALLALGILYAHLAPSAGTTRNAALLLAIIPVALAANLLRVIVLSLVTYHAGDAAGRQWHEVAGLAMFGIALATLVTFDTLISRVSRRRPS